VKKLRELFENVDIKFVTSASNLSQCPDFEGREYALLGRSNVGKSSFLNHIFSSKGIAKVSKQPGKTRLMNYFKLNDEINFVDLPGYGYAKVSHKDREEWGEMIKEYCENRENLAGIIWLIDYRREKGTDIDIDAAAWLASLEIPVFVVLTKSDKLNQKEQAQNFRSIQSVYNFPEELPLLRYTTTRDKSRDLFWNWFHSWVTGK
jgi:GTP-binding protein